MGRIIKVNPYGRLPIQGFRRIPIMKKLLSILLALAMMLSLFGVVALADGEAE